MTIRPKLLAAFLVVALGPFLLSTWLWHVNARDALVHQVLNHLESVASIQHARLVQLHARNRERLGLVASRTQLRLSLRAYLGDGNSTHLEKISRIITDVKAAIPDFRAIAITNPEGLVVAATDPGGTGADRSQDRAFLNGRKAFSVDNFRLDANGAPTVTLAGPLVLDGRLLGVALIESDIANLLAVVSDYAGLGASGETVVLRPAGDGSGLILLPTRFDPDAAMQRRWPGQGSTDPALFFAPHGRPSATAMIDYRGRPVFATSRLIEDHGWAMVVKIDRDEVLADIHRANREQGVIGLLFVAAIVGLSLLLAGRITRPLTSLTEAAARVAAGDLATRLSPAGRDEFGQLAEAFNRMTASLEESRTALSANIRELESEVDRRRQLEEELRDSHEILRRIFDTTSFLIAYLDTDFTFIQVNAAYAAADGRPPDFFPGRNHFELYPNPENEAIFRQVLATGEPYTARARPFEYPGRAERGVAYWDWDLHPVSDSDGRAEGLLLCLVDVTERQRAEEAQRLAQFAVDNAADPIFWIDRRGRILDANRAACERLGYSREELAALWVADIDPIYQPEKWEGHWQELTRCRRLRFETLHRTREGEEFPVEITANYLLFQGREYNCAFVRDITARKQAEEELRRAKEEWENTFEAIGDIATLQDAEMRIVRVNRQACEALGAEAGKLVGRYCYEAFRGASEPCKGCPVAASLHDFGVHSAEIEHYRLGKTFLVSASPVLETDGTLKGMVHFAKDISAQKRLEQQLLQTQKMEAIGTLAGGIAHDFNNILTPILGYSEIVRHGLPAGSPACEEMDAVIQAAGRARDLVAQILTFSRQATQEVRPIKMQYVVKESLKLLRASIPVTIEITERIDPACCPVLADPTQIQQIVINLCTNAYQAMRAAGGTLSLILDSVELGAAKAASGGIELPAGRYARLTVGDTGHGMEKDVLDRIFEPYFTTKPKGEGTGLGLAVVHGIVVGLGGGVTVSSEPGQGTTFEVYLPVLDAALAETVTVPGEELPAGSERICVIDDEEVIVRLYQAMLESLGYRVAAFTDCEEGLRQLRTRPADFDLVITDMTMPRITGVQLAQEVLAVRPEMPIILCTGFSELIDEEGARAMGIRGYLMKPVSKRDLALAVRRVLEKE